MTRSVIDASTTFCLLLFACSGTYVADRSTPSNGRDAEAPSDASSPNGLPADAGPDPADAGLTLLFEDTFDRADGPLGNGWLGRGLAVMTVLDSKASVSPVASYRDAVVYRPEKEASVNLEVQVEVQAADYAGNFPQVHARIQLDTVGTPNTLDSYVLYLEENANLAHVGRARGTNPVEKLSTFSLANGVRAGQSLRLRLQVSGTAPVRLRAMVEDMSDRSRPVLLGGADSEDSSATRLEKAGSSGLSSFSPPGAGSRYSYDNFRALELSPSSSAGQP